MIAKFSLQIMVQSAYLSIVRLGGDVCFGHGGGHTTCV